MAKNAKIFIVFIIYFPCNFLFSSSQSHIACKIGIKLCPRLDKLYSTLGGI
ncbi:hypothetical protein cje96_01499 [Campylobacter jejuni subsp. jejuni LMG 23211]|nr:hypothetical protein cje96_01499 [Campylobacter jejuni subsp. jejuni LMG 23211]